MFIDFKMPYTILIRNKWLIYLSLLTELKTKTSETSDKLYEGEPK